MKLSIIVPIHNEEKTVRNIFDRVKKASVPHNIVKEIIAVDDASTDTTSSILKKMKGITIYTHRINKGKGAAIRTGLGKASGDILLIQDADLEYDPQYYPKLLEPILKNKVNVVYGTRLRNYPLKLFGKGRTPLITHYLGNKLLSFITRILYATNLSDMETGYKVFRREIIDTIELTANRFDIEPEITAKILKKGYKIYEVPIKVMPRGYDEGKKISWKDGFVALWTLIKYRFSD